MECQMSVGGSLSNELDEYVMRLVPATEHVTCYECPAIIQVGELHEHVTAESEDGELFECHTCMDCHHIAEGLSVDRMHGSLWSELDESEDGFEVFTHACLAKIPTASAKQKLVSAWRHWKGLDKPARNAEMAPLSQKNGISANSPDSTTRQTGAGK